MRDMADFWTMQISQGPKNMVIDSLENRKIMAFTCPYEITILLMHLGHFPIVLEILSC